MVLTCPISPSLEENDTIELILQFLTVGVFKTRNGKMAKWRNGEMMIYFSFCFRGKNPIEPGPARKHSTHLHRKSRSFHTANSCKAVLETFHLPIVSIIHPKCREDGAFCFTAISFYFLPPCFFLVVPQTLSHDTTSQRLIAAWVKQVWQVKISMMKSDVFRCSRGCQTV